MVIRAFGKPLNRFFFSDKGINSNKLMLIENDTITTEESDLSEVINNYFTNIIDKQEAEAAWKLTTIKKNLTRESNFWIGFRTMRS